MDYADAIRRQAEDAPRAALPAVTALMWKAFGDGQITEAEAEALSVLIEARQSSEIRHPIGQTPNPSRTSLAVTGDIPSDRQRSPRTVVGSRPRTDASMGRRRRWAASGRLPPALAARFTLAEHAVLALVAAEMARRGDCRLAIERMAAVAGVSRSTVRNAIREARRLGLLTVEERKVSGWRSDTNIVRIVSPEWVAWLRLARKGDPLSKSGSSARLALRGGGVKFPTTTPTQIFKPGKTGTGRPPQGMVATLGAAS